MLFCNNINLCARCEYEEFDTKLHKTLCTYKNKSCGCCVEKEVTWKEELNKVEQCPQRQDSMTDQMIDLYYIANKFGFYDAADYIKQTFKD